MHNLMIFHFHVTMVCIVSILMLRAGKEALNTWLCVVAVAMNLFVTKQIEFVGLHVTASDALAGSYLIGLCFLQEFFGKKAARQHVYFSFCCSLGFLILGWFHLWYQSSCFDLMHCHFQKILKPIPRLVFASLFSFIVVQLLDIQFFSWIRNRFQGRYFEVRMLITLSLAHLSDTIIFTFLGLYGLVNNLWNIIVFSLIVKILCSLIGATVVAISKKSLVKIESFDSS